MTRITDVKDWFELWDDCRQSTLLTMYKNMADDLASGYSLFGHSITMQKTAIQAYEDAYKDALELFKVMDEKGELLFAPLLWSLTYLKMKT